MSKKLEECLPALVQDVVDFCLPPGGQVPRVFRPSPLQFVRDFVATNKPCILTGMMDGEEWAKAMQCWTPEYLAERGGQSRVRINVTPNGHGDCVVESAEHDERVFVKPFETEMSLDSFFHEMREPREGFVPYLSHQNDNLRADELEFIVNEVPSELELGTSCLGALDAVNLWIGDERAVSSMHQDFYENLYCVVEGEKIFHLFPPLIHPKLFLQEGEYTSAHYELVDDDADTQAWRIVLDEGETATKVPWISIDPSLDSQGERFDLYKDALVECRVGRGEILFLPGMWLHRVTQSKLTIAVNYWHEMNFDSRWVVSNFVGGLCTSLSLCGKEVARK